MASGLRRCATGLTRSAVNFTSAPSRVRAALATILAARTAKARLGLRLIMSRAPPFHSLKPAIRCGLRPTFGRRMKWAARHRRANVAKAANGLERCSARREEK